VTCESCHGNGFYTYETDEGRFWGPCACAAGITLIAELLEGQADIKAGRLHKWLDIRRPRSGPPQEGEK
jgi:hypothetical protein